MVSLREPVKVQYTRRRTFFSFVHLMHLSDRKQAMIGQLICFVVSVATADRLWCKSGKILGSCCFHQHLGPSLGKYASVCIDKGQCLHASNLCPLLLGLLGWTCLSFSAGVVSSLFAVQET